MFHLTPRLRDRKQQQQNKDSSSGSTAEENDSVGRPPMIPSCGRSFSADEDDSGLSPEEQVDDLRMRIETVNMQVKLAKEEITNRDSKIQSLERKCRRLEEKVAKAQAEAGSADDYIEELTESKQVLVDELIQAKKDLGDRDTAVRELEKKCHNLEETSGSSKTASDSVAEELKRANSALEESLIEAERRMEDMRSVHEEKLRASEERAEKLAVRVGSHEEELRLLREEELEALDLERDEACRIADDLRRDNSDLSERLASTRRDLEEAKDGLLTRNEEVHRLEQRCEALEQETTDENKISDELVKDLISSSTEMTNKLKTTERDLNQAKEELSNRNEELSKLRDKYLGLERDLADSRTSSTETIGDLESTNSQLADKIKHFGKIIDEKEEEIVLKKEQLHNLKEKCTDFESEVANATSRCEEAVHSRETYEAMVKDLRKASSELADKLKSTEMRLDDLKRDFCAKEEQVQRLEQRCLSLEQEKEDRDDNGYKSYAGPVHEVSGSVSSRVEELEKINFSLNERLKVTETDNDMLEMEIQSLKERCAALESRLEDAQVSEELLEEYEVAKKELTQELEEMVDKSRRLEEKLSEVYQMKDASRERVRDLEDKNRQLTEELEQARTKPVPDENSHIGYWGKHSDDLIEDIQNTFVTLTDLVTTTEKENVVLESEVQCLKRRCMNLEEKLKEAMQSISSLNQLIESKETLSKEVRRAEEKRRNLEEQLQHLEKTCKSFEVQGHSAEQKSGVSEDMSVDSLAEILDGTKGQCPDQSEELRHAKEKLKVLEKELTEVKKKCNSLETENTSDLVDELLTSNAHLTENVQNAQKENSAWKNEVQFLQRKCNGLEQKLLEAQDPDTSEKLKYFQKDRSALQTRVRHLEQKCSALEEKLHERSSPRSVLENPPPTVKDAPEHRRSGSGSKSSKDDSEHRRTGSNGITQDVKWQKYTQSLTKLGSRTVQFQLHLDETKNRVSTLQKEFSMHKNYRSETSAAALKTSQRLQKLANRNDQLQIDLDDARNGVEALEKEASVRKFDTDEAATTLFERTQALKKLASQHKQLHVELVKARSRIVSIQKEIAASNKREGVSDLTPATRAPQLSNIPSSIQIVVEEDVPMTPERRGSPTFNDWEV